MYALIKCINNDYIIYQYFPFHHTICKLGCSMKLWRGSFFSLTVGHRHSFHSCSKRGMNETQKTGPRPPTKSSHWCVACYFGTKNKRSQVCWRGLMVCIYPQSNQHHFGGYHAAGYILLVIFFLSVTICDMVKINAYCVISSSHLKWFTPPYVVKVKSLWSFIICVYVNGQICNRHSVCRVPISQIR